MAYKTTASFDKLTCTDYVDFAKCQVRFEQLYWSRNDSNYLNVKLKVFKKDDNKKFRLVQNLTLGEADFNQFMLLRNLPVNAAEFFAREENLSIALIPLLSMDMDEQLKLSHEVVDRANRRVCVTLLPYSVDRPGSSYAQVRLFAKKKEDEKYQQKVYVKNRLKEFIYLLDVMSSVYEKILLINPFVMSYKKYLHLFTLHHFSFIRVSLSCSIGDDRNHFLKLNSTLGLYRVPSTPTISPEKPTLTVVEMQQLPDIGKTDFKNETSCLKWTIRNGRKKVCVNFETDTDNLNIDVYRYRTNLHLKDNEVDIKLTEYQSLLAKRVYPLSYIDVFYKRCILLDETTVHN